MFRTGQSYALRDADRYDDEHGIGYGRVETYGECEGMYITDCWVVNEEGEIHPGYSESPIPVRFDDVDPSTARPGTNEDAVRSSAIWA